MVNLIVEASKYFMIILFALYTYECFAVFNRKFLAIQREKIYHRQVVYMYSIHLDAFLVMFAVKLDKEYIGFYLIQVVLLTAIRLGYQWVYKKCQKLVLNNMCMLLTIGFIILTRLNYEKAKKQFMIAAISAAITFFIPLIIQKVRSLRKLTWVYAIVGVVMLGVVAVLGATSYGAKISFSIAGITLQPSEFIKIFFVFFVAGRFYESTEFAELVKTTIVAGLHVLILAASKDLGGALIFFVVYLVMLYVATGKLLYFAGGIGAGTVAAVVAYKIFYHVRVRVTAWKDPLSVIDDQGYQICQSLFAIGTGGWFGMGLYQGLPTSIPVVEQDFVFSAIAEELGGLFALCLILVCVSCFLMFLNISMEMKDDFYKLVALGLGIIYGFQVLLTIGGVTKFIPSTGVTLPFVSYGGSSLLSTFIIFAVVQGLYIMKESEGDIREKKIYESQKGGKSKGKQQRKSKGKNDK